MIVAALTALLFTPALQPFAITVDGVERHALIAYPTKATAKAPLVFAFHGHGGNMNYSARRYAIDKEWPAAIVVYMQGLPAKGMTDPEGTKNGWQQRAGTDGDRDIKFFDQTLAYLETHAKVDTHRIYSMGHSNGAAFSYVLWISHPNLFAAIGVVAGGFGRAQGMAPVPLLHMGSETDTVVPYAFQKLSVERVKRINGCTGEGKPWEGNGTMWDSTSGSPVVLYPYEGGHKFPDNAVPLIVKFFKLFTRP